MTTLKYDQSYWADRYTTDNTPWDIGYASPPIVEYFEGLNDKSAKILIPGCGNAHEAAALYDMGFTNVQVMDIAEEPISNFKNAYPDFPSNQVILGDFFEHTGHYDVIVEQTFFCALHPQERSRYIQKMNELLTPEGVLVGVLFDAELNADKPPYGGNKDVYQKLFAPHMDIVKMERCYNSIAPRAGRELFIEMKSSR